MKWIQFRQYIRRNPLTAIIGIGVVFILVRLNMSHPSPQSETAPLPKVSVTSLKAEPLMVRLHLNGHTAEARRVTLKAKTVGRVLSILVKKGQIVEAGQDLILIDPEDRHIRLAEAQSKLHQRELEYKAGTKLEARAFKAQNSLAASKAEFDAAKSALAAIEQEITDTHIKAPFRSVFEETFVEAGDVVDEMNKQVATVIELNPLKIVCSIAEKDIHRITVGGEAQITLPSFENQPLKAHVIYIAKTADPKTRTYRVEMETDNPDMRIPAGLTARIVFPTHKTKGYLVSPAVLSLKDDGVMGVKTIENGKVSFHPVQVVETTPDGLWVTGLPDQITLITTGGDFVIEDQEVTAIAVEPSSLDKSS